MGIWEQFPYTNFHQENLDWAYSAIKDLNERVDNIEQNGGGATKDYVDEQDEKLSSDISRVEKECDTSATAIHGTGGTYDMSKGTIQARLNDLESTGGDLNVTKNTIDYAECFVASSKSSLSVPAGNSVSSAIFVFPRYPALHNAAPDKSLCVIAVAPVNGAPVEFAFSASSYSFSSSQLQVSGSLLSYSSHSSSLSFADSDYTVVLLIPGSKHVVTDVTGGGGSSSDVTKSYVDSQDAALSARITTAQSTADSAVTTASDAQDVAISAVATANSANTTATSAKTAADNAKTAADGAVESARTANDNATKAMSAIGAKSAAVTFSSLWAAIGAWSESATITARLMNAYNWSWNNRSAINGSADYPSDKGTINARLTELEENAGSSNVKIASGSGEVGARTGEDLTIAFESAGFTSPPAVVASYCKAGDNDTLISGIVKVHHVTTTGAVISITGGNTGHMYNVSWIATGA